MEVKIKVLANAEEIEENKRLALRDEVQPRYVISLLNFRLRDLSHVYIDDSQEEQDIIIVLYPSLAYRALWDEATYRKLKDHIEYGV